MFKKGEIIRKIKESELVEYEVGGRVPTDIYIRQFDAWQKGQIELDLEVDRRLAALADNKKIFYIGFEEIFDGEDGAMSPEYSGDGVHLYAKCYKLWRDWILENGKIY